MRFREHTLPNGLEIVAECNPKAHSMAVAFFVRTGSRDETDAVWGVSHFLEHMVFKGTPRRSAADVNRELDEIGSHANAYTSEEQTVYYIAALPEYQARAVDLLSDMMRPSLRDDDFATEKQVILEEIAKYEDQPPFGAHEKSMALHFAGHPLGRSVLGTKDSVTALTPELMRAYFDGRYSPTNMVLAASGNVDFDELVRETDRLCGGWQRFETARAAPPARAKNQFELIHKDIATQQYVVQNADGPPSEDETRFASRVLATIVGDDSGSRMFWELIDTGRAEVAAMWPYDFQGAGIMMTFLCCAPEDTRDNLARIRDLHADVEARGVTDVELAQAKTKICSHLVLRSERSANRLFDVGGNWIQRRQYRTVRETVNQYQAITTRDVAEVLAAYPLSVCSTVAVGPLTSLEMPGGGNGANRT